MKIVEEQSGLEVTAVDNQIKKDDALHPNILHHPFTWCIAGPKGSGKSNLIWRLLGGMRKTTKRPAIPYYKKYFDRVCVFSPTWHLDEKMQKLAIEDEDIFSDENEFPSRLEELLLDQEMEVLEFGRDECQKVLLVFQDLAGNSQIFGHARGPWVKLALNARHYNISILLDTQRIRLLNPAFRSNLQGIACFDVNNRLELQTLAEENANGLCYDEWVQLFHHCVKKRYGFLFINYQKSLAEGRFFNKFNQLTISCLKSEIKVSEESKTDTSPADPPK